LFFLFFVSSFVLKAQQTNLPIIAFQGIPENYNRESHFKRLKEAGFNVNLNMYSNVQSAIEALQLGEKTGVKIILSVPELKGNPEKIAKIFKKYPAFLGYYVEDEPNVLRFSELSTIVAQIRKNDSKHFIYINLMPTYASKDLYMAKSYDDYVKQFITKVNPGLISFDHYPIVNNTVREDFYENLEIIRANAYKYNIPFWAFACTAIHFAYKEPTLQSVKLQQFGNLLYGAQGLQYYTYWTVNNQHWKENNYSYAIVDDKGDPTPTFSIVRDVNKQIQRLDWVFSGAKSDLVFHTGNIVAIGTSKLQSIPKQFKFFSTYGKSAVISLMSNNKNKFIIVQNRSLDENLNLEYRLQNALKKINNNTGKTEQLSVSKKYIDTILPGDILIFTYTR
jgi:hypothetical protein